MSVFSVAVRVGERDHEIIAVADDGPSAMRDVRAMFAGCDFGAPVEVWACRWIDMGESWCPECGASDNAQCFPHCGGWFHWDDYMGGE